MAADFEMLGPDDKPALIAMASAEAIEFVRATLVNLGYKTHVASNADDFIARFTQVNYQVVVVEELFEGATQADNRALNYVQKLPMARRRHATLILVGMSYQTMHVMQAFQQSVHMVVNPQEYANLPQLVQKAVADNQLFLATFKEVQRQIASGKS